MEKFCMKHTKNVFYIVGIYSADFYIQFCRVTYLVLKGSTR